MGNSQFRKARKFETYTKTYEFDETLFDFVTVRSEEDIVSAVKKARETNVGVRAMGSKYSWERVIEPPTSVVTNSTQKPIILDMTQYNKAVDIDPKKMVAQVQGGMTIRKMNEVLDFHGLAMFDIGNVDGQTIAGVVATGTHGENPNGGVIPSYLTRMWIVNGMGEVIEVDMTDKTSDLAKAAGVSLGLLGVISRVEFAVTKEFDVRNEIRVLEFDDMISDYKSLLEKNDYFQAGYIPQLESFRIDTNNRITKKIRDSVEYPAFSSFEKRLTRSYAVLASYDIRIKAIERALAKSSAISSRVVEAPSYKAIPNGRTLNIDHYELDVVIPASKFPEFMTEVREVHRNTRVPLYPIDIRFNKKDSFFMSRGNIPGCKNDDRVVWLNFLTPKLDREGKFLGGKPRHIETYNNIAPIAIKYGGKLHWGKINSFFDSTFTADSVVELEKFQAVRREMDPQNIFAQPHIDALLTGNKTPTTDGWKNNPTNKHHKK